MEDRWVVAYESDEARSGKFVLAHCNENEIAVFPSKHDAQIWFYNTCMINGFEVPETIYIKIPAKQPAANLEREC